MGISLKGHSPNFQDWVFDIDGNTWVAVNQSTPEPLNINFVGRYRPYPDSLPLINTSGFNIISSTTASTNDLGEKQGVVEWTWAGQKYRSKWLLSAGREIIVGDAETPSVFEYGLNFVGRIPYDGPAGGAVGTGIQSQASMDAQSAAKTKDEREAAELTTAPAATVIIPGAQLATGPTPTPSPAPAATRPVNTGIPSQAALAASNQTKDEREAAAAAATPPVATPAAAPPPAATAAAATPPPTRPVNTGVPSQAALAASNKTKEDIEASTAYKTYAYSNQTPVQPPAPYTPPPQYQTPVGITQTPVLIPGTKDAREAAAAPATDWVKLAIQLGAAYLLFS